MFCHLHILTTLLKDVAILVPRRKLAMADTQRYYSHHINLRGQTHSPQKILCWFVRSSPQLIFTHLRTWPTPPHSLLWGNLKVMGETAQKYPAQSYFSPIFGDIAATNSLDGLYYLDLYPFSEPFVFILDPDLELQAQTSPSFTRHPMSVLL